jgi:glucose/arabinose dehydrogenase
VNGQDKLGTRRRPEPAETVVAVREGAFYGWPRCSPSYRLRRLIGRCAGVTPPAAYLEPHSSADGLAFYTGHSFPDAYRGDLFVALWGQYLSKRHGRRVVRVKLGPDGTATRATEFARGFDHPLALEIDSDGALLVADWGRGVIYRIQSRGG